MKKKKLLIAIFLCVLFAFAISHKQTVFAVGETEIYSSTDLSKVRSNLSGTYKMMANIYLPADFTPIGTADEPFTGKFDGNGFQISNLKIVSENSYLGFFGYTKGAEIKGLTIEGRIQGDSFLGGLVGYADSSTIYNCISKVIVNAKINFIQNYKETLTACSVQPMHEMPCRQYP